MDNIWLEMLDAAKAVRRERRVSDYVTCGEVSAAIRSKSGRIYTGVCVDTCSTLGICAERNALFNMLTNGEQEIDRVVAILSDGSSGAPCGACRQVLAETEQRGGQPIRYIMYGTEGTMVVEGGTDAILPFCFGADSMK